MKKIFVCSVIFVLGIFGIVAVPSPEVCARDGCMRGKYESNKGRKPYEAFYGIPYAEPPVGKFRFENPVPHRGWNGYWDASYYRNDCYQRNYFFKGQPIVGSEDCLYLNVYRPYNWNQGKKLPVLIYIHGGAFLSFSSNPNQVGPEYLMDTGRMILVSLNYRLGIFGFLASGDDVIKGNFALKDQQLALEWIARSIEAFGGDRNDITLFGQSCGATAVHLQLMNSKSSSLFHRVIMLSGTAIASFTYPIDVPTQFREAAQKSGLTDWRTGTTTQLAYQLKKMDARSLLQTQDNMFLITTTPPVPFRPFVEGNWEGAFMTEDPRTIWAEGRFNQKPMITGYVADEGIVEVLITQNETTLAAFNEGIYTYLPTQFDFAPRYTSDVLKFYFGKKDYIDQTNAESYYQLFMDRFFVYPLHTLIDQYLQYADVEMNPIYLYEFAYRGNNTFMQEVTDSTEDFGVAHFDDLIYIFKISALFAPIQENTPDGHMRDILIQTIVDFVTKGQMKVWRPFRLCSKESYDGTYCDYQIWRKYEKMRNAVVVSVSNYMNKDMVDLWDRVDYGVKSISLIPCP